MKLQLKKRLVCVAAGMTALLAACGGGGGGGNAGAANGGGTTALSTTTPVTITVVDGPIAGAMVCLDKNENGACDTEDAPRTTDTNGQATFTVPNAEVGKYPALVWVNKGATDRDTGAVPTRYTMKAPKDAVHLVTPLTTLVQTLVETTGASTQDAAAAVQLQLGMKNSPLDDFTQNGDANAQAIANAVVVTAQAQADLLKDAVGASTSSGTVITQLQLDQLVAQKVLDFASWFAFVAADKLVTGATSATARVAVLNVKAQEMLGSSGIPNAPSALLALAHIRQSRPGNGFSSGLASAWLAYLSFDAPDDVYARYITSSASENTPAGNNTRYHNLRYQAYPNGDVSTWATQGGPKWGGTLHWNGSSWKVCGIQDAHISSVPDANGNSSYNECDGLERGTTNSKTVDIGGQKMLEVYQSILSQGYFNLRVGDSRARATTLLGTAVFPAGSKLGLRKTLNTSNAFAYYPGSGNYLELPDAQLAAGNAAACDASVDPQSSSQVSLDQTIARLRGTPCVYASWSGNRGLNGAFLDSGSRNEGWGNTTLSLGSLGDAKTVANLNEATAFYTGNTLVRVAFGDAGLAKYYACQESWSGSVRNCTAAGTGTYVIETLGDARVLYFTGLPQMLRGAQSWERVYIERQGQVRYGYRDLPYPATSAWLNLPAANALLVQLGTGRSIDPGVGLALTASSYEGTYKGIFFGDATAPSVSGLFTFNLAAGKVPTCSGSSNALVSASNLGGTFTCSNVVLNPGAAGSTEANITFGTTSSGESFTGKINFYTGAVSGSWISTSGAKGAFRGLRQ
ncbi:hypothetical protein [Rhodoferax lacus]|nr:hypothetical protein [Rhodoferax lacus]